MMSVQDLHFSYIRPSGPNVCKGFRSPPWASQSLARSTTTSKIAPCSPAQVWPGQLGDDGNCRPRSGPAGADQDRLSCSNSASIPAACRRLWFHVSGKPATNIPEPRRCQKQIPLPVHGLYLHQTTVIRAEAFFPGMIIDHPVLKQP